MREALKDIDGIRKRFSGTFVRFGKKRGWKGIEIKTLLFENITTEGNVVCDHIWFTITKEFERLDLQEGDRVSFEARVKHYWKGYKGRREDDDLPPITKDYKLSHPKNISVYKTGGKQLNLF
jgi:hypothetical protein